MPAPNERIATVSGLTRLYGVHGVPFIEEREALDEIGALAQAHAQIELIQAQNAHDTILFQLQDEPADSVQGIGGFWDDLKAAAQRAAQQVQAAAQRVQQAAQTAVNQAQQAAQHAVQQAQAAGQSVTHATQAAQASVRRAVQHARVQVLSVIDKAHLTPAQRVLVYLALPPPVGFAAVYKYVRSHQDEVIDSLPPAFRDNARSTVAYLKRYFALPGEASGISGFYTSPQGQAYMQSHKESFPGEYRFARFMGPTMDAWSDAWYHYLTKAERVGLIVLLVILVIVLFVVLYFSSGTAATEFRAMVRGAYEAIEAFFKDFAKAIGWNGFLNGATLLMSWIRGGSPPPFSVPDAAGPAPTNPDVAATADAMNTLPDPSDPTGVDPNEGFRWSAYGAGALAVLAAV